MNAKHGANTVLQYPFVTLHLFLNSNLYKEPPIFQISRFVQLIDFENISFGYEGTIYTNVNSALLSLNKPPKSFNFIGGLGGRDISQQEFFEMIDELKQASDIGQILEPRLLYTKNELTEIRNLQAIAQAEHSEIHNK